MLRMARVVVEGLTKVFTGPSGERITAVDRLNLAVADRELLALVGPSGCGKTTTLRLIAGLEEPSSGTISIDGRVMNGVDAKERDVAMVFQNQALYPHLSVYENLALGLRLRKVPGPEIERRLRETADMMDLADCLERKPEELSGGQRQRVALGRAIVRNPGLVLFDEPLSNLDPRMRVQMRSELARLHARIGCAMIYVTHDQGEAMALGDRLAVMEAGSIQQVDAPLNIYRKPANLFVAGFIGSPPMNLFRGTIVRRSDALFFQGETSDSTAGDGKLRLLRLEPEQGADLEGYVEKPIMLGLRPEHFGWAVNGNAASGEWTVDAMVEVVEPLGSETYVHLVRGSQLFVARAPASADIRVGHQQPVHLDLRQAHFFDTTTGLAIG
jgi:multiple sugar transport system ATP-binding protein